MSDVMDGPETTCLSPPRPTAPLVIAHRKRLEIERDALRAGAAELALKSAFGDNAARAELRAIPAKLDALQFELDHLHAAGELARQQDSDAEIAWRGGLQSLPPDQLLAGLNRDECCRACQPGIPGGCVLSGGAPFAGPACWHPTRFGNHHQFSTDDAGLRVFAHRDHEPAAKLFRAATDKLKVTGRFAS